MRRRNLNYFGVLAIISLVFGIIGCGDSGKSDVANFSGAWQSPSNHLKIVLNFNGDSKTIAIDGKTFPVTIKKSQADRYSLSVSDPTSGEKEWKLFRIWDDNGSTFKLRFEHDGKTEELNRATG
jgi:hypothetical protein